VIRFHVPSSAAYLAQGPASEQRNATLCAAIRIRLWKESWPHFACLSSPSPLPQPQSERYLTDARRSGINGVRSVFLSAILRREAGDMIDKIVKTRRVRSLSESLVPQI
jgi:hypothetical protein